MSAIATPSDLTHDAPARETELVTYGVLAEYGDVDGVVEAAKACRDAGYTKFDVYAPFPIHGIEAAMGMKPTILPWIVLCCGLTGLTVGTLLTTYTMGGLNEWLGWTETPLANESLQPYAFMIAGKPFGELPQFIPPMYELTILLSAFGSVFGMFALNKLPMLYHPLYRINRFRRATDDRFFVCVEAGDPQFSEKATSELLSGTEPMSVETVQEENN